MPHSVTLPVPALSSVGPVLLVLDRLPGMEPNAPRRNVLLLLVYALVVGAVYWLLSTAGGVLEVAFETASRLDPDSDLPVVSSLA